VVDGLLREALESQEKDTNPLLHLVHSDDLKSADNIDDFFNAFFQAFVV
jgi:hypothetical protein